MDPDLRRFAQAVRRQVRLYVQKSQAPPPMLCWVPLAGDIRSPVHTDFSEAEDSVDVRATIREAIETEAARLCAVGRMLVARADHDHVRSDFGLVVISALDVCMWSTFITRDLAGRWSTSAWEPDAFPAGSRQAESDWLFAQQAIRTVAKAGAR